MSRLTSKKIFWINDMEAVMVIMIILLVLGSINVFSSSFIVSEMDYGTPYFYLRHQGMNLLVGIAALIFCMKLNYHNWRKFIPFILAFTLVALVAVLIIGTEINGAKRWLGVGGLQIQPAEIAKLVSILLMAAYLASRVKRGQEANPLSPQSLLVIVMCALIELEPDGGTMGIVFLIPLILLFIAGIRKIYRWIIVVGGLVGMVGLLFLQPYRMARLRVLFDPWADAQNVGYQTVQSLSAIGSGGFWGMGLGLGVSKYNYLPEAHTDFAFAVFCQENGFIGALFVLFLYSAFMVYGVRIAKNAEDIYGQFLATGILLLISVQAIINLLMVGGVFPVIGVPLPFISYGGTSLIISMASVGILLNVGYHGALNQGGKAEGGEVSIQHPKAPHLRLVKK